MGEENTADLVTSRLSQSDGLILHSGFSRLHRMASSRTALERESLIAIMYSIDEVFHVQCRACSPSKDNKRYSCNVKNVGHV
jgi:hypothetical protein